MEILTGGWRELQWALELWDLWCDGDVNRRLESIAMGFVGMGFVVRWRCLQEDGENCNGL